MHISEFYRGKDWTYKDIEDKGIKVAEYHYCTYEAERKLAYFIKEYIPDVETIYLNENTLYKIVKYGDSPLNTNEIFLLLSLAQNKNINVLSDFKRMQGRCFDTAKGVYHGEYKEYRYSIDNNLYNNNIIFADKGDNVRGLIYIG